MSPLAKLGSMSLLMKLGCSSPLDEPREFISLGEAKGVCSLGRVREFVSLGEAKGACLPQ